MVCKKRRGEEKEVKVDFLISSPHYFLLQENGRPSKREEQKKKRPGRERKWVRRYIVHCSAITSLLC